MSVYFNGEPEAGSLFTFKAEVLLSFRASIKMISLLPANFSLFKILCAFCSDETGNGFVLTVFLNKTEQMVLRVLFVKALGQANIVKIEASVLLSSMLDIVLLQFVLA